MGDVGEVSMVDWAFLVRGALGKGESRYLPSNYIGVGDTDTWGCEGSAGSLAMWVLQSWHGRLPPFSVLHQP